MPSPVGRALGLRLVRGPISVQKNKVISVILLVLALSILLTALILRMKVTAVDIVAMGIILLFGALSWKGKRTLDR
jgi:hypothetical protein